MRNGLVVAVSLIVTLAIGCAGCVDQSESGWSFDADGVGGEDAGADADADDGPDLGVPETCGDGEIDEGEVCDGEALGGATCETFGYPDGELECMESCAGYLVEECRGIPEWTPTTATNCTDCADDEVCVDGECTAPSCDGPADDLSEFDSDVKTHAVEGDVTIDGQPLSSWTDGEANGRVYFKQEGARYHTRFDIDDTGAFAGEIPEGRYDVYWQGPLERPSAPLPLDRDLVIDRDRDLELDAERPEEATLEIEAPDWFPDFGADLTIALAEHDLHHASETVELNEASRHSVEVFLGAPARVELDSVDGEALEEAYPQLGSPTAGRPHVVAESLEEAPDEPFVLPLHRLTIEADEVDDPVETPDPEIEADVYREGMADPDSSPASRAELSYGESVTLPVLAGGYRVEWEGMYSDGKDDLNMEADRTHSIGAGVRFAGTRIDVDEARPEEVDEARVRVRHPELPDWFRTATYEAGAQIHLPIPRGEIDIEVEFRADGEHLETVRATDVEFDGEETFRPDFEPVDTVRLRGEVLFDGDQMPDNETTRTVSQDGEDREEPIARGRIQFTCVDDCFVGEDVSLGARGPATYDVELPEGVYEVEVRTPPGSDWGLPTPQDVIPSPGYVLHPRLEVDGDQSRRDFDMRLARVDVTVLEDGGVLSPLSGWSTRSRDQESRGSVSLRRTNRSPYGTDYPFEPHSDKLDESGDADFELLAYPGHYRLGVRLAGAGRIDRGLHLEDDTEVTFDVSLTHLDEELTFNGDAWSEDDSRSASVFIDGIGGWLYDHGDLRDEGHVSGTLFGGRHTISWGRRARAAAYSFADAAGDFIMFEGCVE
ncbi:MAG: hypothetical protein ACOCV2_06105 [Persicimonas sp.]